ncbi:MAG: putative O-glycosylation ligase, exosortase A system-associated [Acetobacteraceae bacterium]
MRSAALFFELLLLLPITLVRPFVGVILWSWFSFMNPHRLVYGGIALAVPWAMLIFFGTLFGCLAAREPKRLPVNAFTILVALFLVMITITTAFALGPWDDVLNKYEIVAKSFLFLLITCALLSSRERIHALVWVLVLSLAFFGIKGGGFTLLGGGVNKVFGPESTMIGDNNHLATALLVCLPLMNYLRMESRHPIMRYGITAAMVLTLFAVVGSYSRGALLALGAVSAYFWWKSPGKIVSGALLVIAVATAIMFMPESWMDRMHSIQDYNADDSAMGRLDIWSVAWQMAIQRPLVGGGFFATYTQPVVNMFVPGGTPRAVHSIWFEVLGEHGFPTFFVWFGMTIAGAVYARRAIKLATGVPGLEWSVNLARMIQVSIIAYLVGGTFLSLCYWDYYFTMLAAAVAVYEVVKATIPQPTVAARLGARAMPARMALSR